MTGYSDTPLPNTLGLKAGYAVAFAALPKAQRALLSARAFASVENVKDWHNIEGDNLDYIHFFTASAAAVKAATPVLCKQIKADGMIWMSWPKKASQLPTDVTEDVIRDQALADVLVDTKVCAVDEIWSGLKLVVRKQFRAAHKNT